MEMISFIAFFNFSAIGFLILMIRCYFETKEVENLYGLFFLLLFVALDLLFFAIRKPMFSKVVIEDGNGRTARILSNYVLSYYGYGFKDIGSLEEYFAYDIEEYYNCLQMGLPALYYDGRNNPPHPEIWIKYFLKVFSLYANKVLQIVNKEVKKDKQVREAHLSSKSKTFLLYLRKNQIDRFTPIDLSKKLDVTNRTIINWCTELSNNGFLKPLLVNSRIRHYEVIKENEWLCFGRLKK